MARSTRLTRNETRSVRAGEAMERAEIALGEALSLLGGRVRARPIKLPYPAAFLTRQFIESTLMRLQVARYCHLGSIPAAKVSLQQAIEAEELPKL